MKTFILVFVCVMTVTLSISSWGWQPQSQKETYSVFGCHFPFSDFNCEIGQSLSRYEGGPEDCVVNMLDESLTVTCNNALPQTYHCGSPGQRTGTFHINESSKDVWTCS